MRLIDADRLLETLSTGGHSSVRKVISREPTIDAVEVVRCKDCKHYGANIKYRPPYYNFAFCYKFHHNITRRDDFCSYGERKEVDNG